MLRGWLSRPPLPRQEGVHVLGREILEPERAGLKPPVHQGQVESVGLERVDRKAANAEPLEEPAASWPVTSAREHHADHPTVPLHAGVRLVRRRSAGDRSGIEGAGRLRSAARGRRHSLPMATSADLGNRDPPRGADGRARHPGGPPCPPPSGDAAYVLGGRSLAYAGGGIDYRSTLVLCSIADGRRSCCDTRHNEGEAVLWSCHRLCPLRSVVHVDTRWAGRRPKGEADLLSDRVEHRWRGFQQSAVSIPCEDHQEYVEPLVAHANGLPAAAFVFEATDS
jgi:hypothetical protein